MEEFAAQIKDKLAEADWLTKRELIRTLVKRVEIGKEAVNIVFRVMPDPFESSPDRGTLQHCWRVAILPWGVPTRLVCKIAFQCQMKHLALPVETRV